MIITVTHKKEQLVPRIGEVLASNYDVSLIVVVTDVNVKAGKFSGTAIAPLSKIGHTSDNWALDVFSRFKGSVTLEV